MKHGIAHRCRRLLLPAAGFTAVLGAHFLWLGLFPEQNPAQAGWASVSQQAGPQWLQRYIETGSYWMGYTYALSLAFALVAFRQYREQRFCGAGRLAIGSVSVSGVLSVAGCFLIGCCGSPMLGVYLSLFGASVLPFAKPIIAALTTFLLLGSYLWMRYRAGKPAPDAAPFDCCKEITYQSSSSQI